MSYNIQLQIYNGPLDLLYDLITKHKIDIKDISILEITKQYISYLNEMEKMDLEVTSEFISMACKLLEIKSKYLLYKQREDEDEQDPRLELMQKLEEYKKFKNASEFLKQRANYEENVFYRRQEEIIVDEKIDLQSLSIKDIIKILPNIIKVEVVEEIKDEKLNKIYKARIISIKEKMDYVREKISSNDEVKFNELILNSDKDEIIATFLSMLELIKSKEVYVEQDTFFEDIKLKKNAER